MSPNSRANGAMTKRIFLVGGPDVGLSKSAQVQFGSARSLCCRWFWCSEYSLSESLRSVRSFFEVAVSLLLKPGPFRGKLIPPLSYVYPAFSPFGWVILGTYSGIVLAHSALFLGSNLSLSPPASPFPLYSPPIRPLLPPIVLLSPSSLGH